jgi:molybdenum cofactor synthesis domain-containing protein
LGPAEIGVLTSVGFTEIRATRRPRVAILPSGSEIVEPGRDLRPGEVYNSNAAALRALVLAAGGDPMVHPAVEDTFDAHDRALAQAAQAADLIVTTGGTSVGERDYLSSVIEQRGRVLVHGVRLRPGKPTLVGSLPCPGKTGDDPGLGPGSPEVPMLGLPGYPASALVTGELFAVEAVRRLLGSRRGAGLAFLSRWRDDVSVRPDVTTLVPVKHEGGAVFSIYKESGALTSLAGSDGYALFPEGSKSPKAGSVAEVHAWSWQSAF